MTTRKCATLEYAGLMLVKRTGGGDLKAHSGEGGAEGEEWSTLSEVAARDPPA